MNILLVGANGRMGSIIQKENYKNVSVVAGLDINKGGKIPVYNYFSEISQKLMDDIDMVLDFSNPCVLTNELIFCKKNKLPLVVCCTGHSEKQMAIMTEYSKHIPILKLDNTSFGIYIIKKMLNSVKALIGDYDVCIIEAHHKNKKDAPSGTAKLIKNILENESINTYSIRVGSVVGEHEVRLLGKCEQISIKHIAEDRSLFAKGALKICEKFSHIKNNGMYEIDDIF